VTTTRICRATLLWICAGNFGVSLVLAATDPANSGAGQPVPDLSVGQAAYEQHCARCHGIAGKGDGRDAKRFVPRPRDLTEGVFKFRSTATGSAPTDEDLFQTLTLGLPGSGMPDWRHLDEHVRWQLVSYLKTLSTNFETNPPQPVPLGQDPGSKEIELAQGKQVYEKLGCAACHGATGRANGPSATALMDNWGQPIRPADLTQGWNYRGGAEPRAIVTRILTGIDGSPMPSYAEAATTEETWQLAYYVRALQQEPRWTMIVRAPFLESLPESSEDPRWAVAERAEVRLRNVVDANGQMNAPQSVTTVSLQAVHDEATVRFRIAWHDATEDRSDPVDTLALVLRPADVVGDMVTLQTWPLADSSHHLSEAAAGSPSSPPQSTGQQAEETGPSGHSQVVGSPALDLCVWSADHLNSREGIANLYEPVLEATGQTVPLASQATYHDGEWVVVLTRPFAQSGLERAAQFALRRFTPVAFTIWDGGNPAQRAVSTWVDVVLQERPVEPPRSTGDVLFVWMLAGAALVAGLVLVFRRS